MSAVQIDLEVVLEVDLEVVLEVVLGACYCWVIAAAVPGLEFELGWGLLVGFWSVPCFVLQVDVVPALTLGIVVLEAQCYEAYLIRPERTEKIQAVMKFVLPVSSTQKKSMRL